MGTYTVFIRQDQADCRMGNFVCELAPVPPLPAPQPAVPPVCSPPWVGPNPNGALDISLDDTMAVLADVVSGEEGFDLDFPGFVVFSDSLHIQGICDHKSFESHLVL